MIILAHKQREDGSRLYLSLLLLITYIYHGHRVKTPSQQIVNEGTTPGGNNTLSSRRGGYVNSF